MHDSFQGVNVEIISEGKTLKFYDDPDEEPAPRTRQLYVEAVTDAIFKVRVTLGKIFPLYWLGANDAVRLTVNYDGQKLGWYNDFSKLVLLQCWSEGRSAKRIFAATSRYCNETQQWISGDTSFGALTTSGLSFVPSLGSLFLIAYTGDTVDSGPSVAEVKDLGKIRVSICRVHRTMRALPIHTQKDAIEKPIVEVSEKMLKGKAITNTVRYYVHAVFLVSF